MMIKGSIVNEWGDTVGRYWLRDGMGRYSVSWLGCRMDGYTEDGLNKWALKLDYYLVED